MKKKQLKKLKKEVKGITLIALVVTIIVLLILASVAISLTIGQNGIFTRAQEASKKYEEASTNEQKSMEEAANELNGYLEGTGNNLGEANPGTTVEEAMNAENINKYFKKTTTIKDSTNKDVTIPGGFKIHPDSSTSVNEGIVITDGTNEFVWVPVDDPSTMFIDADAYLQYNSVKTDVYSNLKNLNAITNYTVGKPGDYANNIVREPDTLRQNEDTQAASEYVEQFKKMSNSVKKYKGFYVGRYEMTGTIEKPTEAKGEVLHNQDWKTLYNASKKVVSTEYAQTSMIYGCQWDEIMQWLINSGEKTSEQVAKSSRDWGNYGSFNEDQTDIIPSSPIETGSNSNYQANKIFDLAGNYVEFTQEANSLDNRTTRGGGYTFYQGVDMVDLRMGYSMNTDSEYKEIITTRATLYIVG